MTVVKLPGSHGKDIEVELNPRFHDDGKDSTHTVKKDNANGDKDIYVKKEDEK
jgi:hypothetical protein